MQEWPSNYQDVFWGLYPRRLDKKKTMQKLEIIRKLGVPFSDIINGVEGYARYVQGTEPQFIKHPTTWLNGRCWENEYPAHPRSNESAFVAGVANVAARYGVTAGMGQAQHITRAIHIDELRTSGSGKIPNLYAGIVIQHQPKPPTDSK